ncbi:putative Cytochrome P450 [Seiridium unicorne]|uniref:Cytochrome P450 n=1 Tax=Seiridium unicorne TaxID=138068 RepID=A0ABR2V5F1_9PEZI
MDLDLKASDFSVAQIILLISDLWLVYQVIRAVYNISPFHPLHNIPGPKLAAATYLPEFYHDVILVGRYSHAIQRMHEEYGPIVRINPRETHCNDVGFSDEIYALGGRKRDKPFHQINGSACSTFSIGTGNAFGTKDHDLHRSRRGPVAKFFSYSMIAQLESEIHDLVHKLCDKLLAQSGKEEPIDIAMAYSCFTSDAIFGYSFGESQGLLDQQGWYPNYREATLAVLKPVFVLRFFPFLLKLQDLAILFMNYLPEDTALLLRSLKITIPGLVSKAKAELNAGIHRDRPTVFGTLLESDLDIYEKRSDRLAEEAVAVVNAGTETTSWALAVITFHLISQPQTLSKLKKELEETVKDPTKLPPWTVLEKLPYLGAVIQEGLRLSYGVSARTSREPTQEHLIYRGEFNKKPVQYVLPKGYAIGMSAAITHHDESVFPDSHSFIAERWLDENSQRRKDLERGLLAFSKGSRACLGKNLALCELHLSLTALVLRVIPRMTLFETTQRDVAYDHDMFIPRPVSESTGVRVTIE